MKPNFFPCAGSRALHAPTRREFVYGLGTSLGSVALTSLLAAEQTGPLAPKAQQIPAKAKNCIFLMMEAPPTSTPSIPNPRSINSTSRSSLVRESKNPPWKAASATT